MRILTTCMKALFAALLLVALSGTALAQRNITLKLNTATAPDTLNAADALQVRGALDGQGGATLPDGNVIDWNDNTTLRPTNVGGDYWEVSFQIPDNSMLEFKFYAQLLQDDNVGGWEDGGNHVIDPGTGDTTLVLHFFEKGEDMEYDWRPYESKEDSVAVWFRVFMNTQAAGTVGYDRTDMSQRIGVRGSDLDGVGPLNWDGSAVLLSREDTESDAAPGYDLFSGVAWYPTSAAGEGQSYKFYVEPLDSGWETSDDRTFTVPASDTTLHWVFFSNSPPAGEPPVEGTVIFAVDTEPFRTINLFEVNRNDSLEVRGDFNGWGCSNPDLCQLLRFPGTTLFDNAIILNLVRNAELSYKFFLNFNDETFMTTFGMAVPDNFGWEEPISRTGANRKFVYEGIGNQDLGVQYFNDIQSANIIEPGTSVDLTFHVDMTPALTPETADPFVPSQDTVLVNLGEDAIWAFTMGLPREGDEAWSGSALVLQDDDGDLMYSGTATITGATRNGVQLGTYSGIQYRYLYRKPDMTETSEQGGGFSDVGRRRTRFIHPNADGSWPAAFEFERDAFQEDGLLPTEENPAATGVEQMGTELPTQVSLGRNYPNPFNPTTTFEYAIDEAMQVVLKVYDLLGRPVATLVDGVQQPATYQVTFDASSLASGVYLYRLETPGHVLIRQMVLVK